MGIINFYIGERIRILREDRDVTQEKLAEGLNCSRASIVNIEAGRQSVSLIKLYDIGNFLNEEVAYFLPEKQWVQKNKNKKVKKIVTFEFYD